MDETIASQRTHEGRLITGATRLFAIVADPIYHVKTPQTMNALFERLGLDCVLVPHHVKPAGLANWAKGMREIENFCGFIATVPHKPTILSLCDEVTETARQIGAVNCVRREPDGALVGTMLDGIGFVEAIRSRGYEVKNLRVFLVGAGGAASAIAFALAEAGVRHITVSNRTVARSSELVQRLTVVYPNLSVSVDASDVENHDLIVNGSTLGMRQDDPPPLDFSKLHAKHWVADAIMQPAMTPMLTAAVAKGCTIFPGKPMLDAQIGLMAQFMGSFPTQTFGTNTA